MHTSIKLVKRVAHTVLCKRNANEIRCFSFFVLAKTRRNFATKFRPSARERKRNFDVILVKFRFAEISSERKFALAKFRQGENSL